VSRSKLGKFFNQEAINHCLTFMQEKVTPKFRRRKKRIATPISCMCMCVCHISTAFWLKFVLLLLLLFSERYYGVFENSVCK